MAQNERRRSPWGWILIGGEVALVLMIVAWFLKNGREDGDTAPPAPAASTETTEEARTASPPAASPDAGSAVTAAEEDIDTAESAEPPSVELVRVDATGNALVAGRAAAGATVAVLVEGAEVARARTGADGSFAVLFDLPPSAEPRELSLRMDLADGRGIASSTTMIVAPDPVQRAGDGPAPADVAMADSGDAEEPSSQDTRPIEMAAAPVGAEDAAPDDGGAALPSETAASDLGTLAPAADAEPRLPAPRAPAVLLSDASGVRLLQPPGGDAAPAAPGLAIEAISYDAAGAVLLSGRGGAGAPLRLYLDNAAITGGAVDDTGRWALRLDGVAPGVYTLRADQLNPDGTVAARFETPFQREPAAEIAATARLDTETDGALQARVITVQPGFTLWGIADRTYGSGFQYVKIFRANADQIRDPDLIYPGQVFELPQGD